MPAPQSVLVVEDEYLLAADLTRSLADAGATVLGPVATADNALAVLEAAAVDCVLLDINLRGQMSYPLARRLSDSGIPFLFVTGYDAAAPDDLAGVELLRKPFDIHTVLGAIARATGTKPSG